MNDDARLRNNYAPSPTSYGPPPQRLGRPPMSAIGLGYQNDPRDRRDSFSNPPPSATFRQQPQSHHIGMMEPPPRPLSNGQYPRGPPTGRASTFDESLRLPPLQTQINDPSRRPSSIMTAQPQHNREVQAKSVEAMVMTIPYLNKIRVLTKISPPLAAPGPMSPAPETRGAIIAVEGTDRQLVASVGNFLRNHLEKEGEFLIETWHCAPSPPTPTTPRAVLAPQSQDKRDGENGKERSHDGDSEMTDANTTVNPSDVSRMTNAIHGSSTTAEISNQEKLDAPFLNYLDTIRTWHQHSQDMVKFITTTPSAQPSQTQQTSTPPQTDTASMQQKKPIALLPQGFSLTTSDHYARSIPINDAYAPVDHWQWMATLWRGIVGPDLTIYVDSPQAANLDNSAGGGGDGGGLGSGGKDWSQQQLSSAMNSGVDGVDVRKDCNAIIVRCGDGGGVDDRTLRRLGFEVLEVVRADVGERERFGV